MSMLLCSPARAAGGVTSVLVLNLRAEGVPSSMAKTTTAQIAQAIGGRAGYSVLTQDILQRSVDEDALEQLARCEDRIGCVVRASAALEPDLIVSGSVGMIGATVTLNLALIDRAEVTVKGRVSRPVGSDNARAAVASAVALLMGWGDGPRRRFSLGTGRERSFAVMNLVATGIDESSATNLTEILSAELEAIDGTRVISRSDIQAMLTLEGDRQMLGCADDTSCLAEIGGALGVDYLVAGHVGRIAGTFVVSLRLIAPKAAEVKNRVTESYSGQEDQLVGAVRLAARELLGVSHGAQGELAFAANESGAALYLDGKELGTLPRDTVAGLSPGRHSVRVTKEEFQEWNSEVYVEPGGATRLVIELSSLSGPWYANGWLWTGVGAVVIGGVVTTWLLMRSSDDGTHPFALDVGIPDR